MGIGLPPPFCIARVVGWDNPLETQLQFSALRIAAPSHQRRLALGLLPTRPRTVLPRSGHWHRPHERLLRHAWDRVVHELGLEVARTAARHRTTPRRQLAVSLHHHLGVQAAAPIVVPVISCVLAFQVQDGQHDEKGKDHNAYDDADARLE
ncbi:hypothetical protein PG993_008684 [Apiospora rasikravindrae]|uniref:Uncharacterized protein n=1 Tax=Apiospora rasikravindrae TaxID=990691 RepID=A0ABR1SQV9_9PEZI